MTSDVPPGHGGRTAVLVLAGGKNSPEMQAAATDAAAPAGGTGTTTNRALIPVGPEGHTMLDYVIAAVRKGVSSEGADVRLLVAGDVPLPAGCEAVPGGTSLVDTLMNGVRALRPDETRLLVVTADIPFLTPDAVADFLRQASAAPRAQFHYPIVEAGRCEARFPEMRRTTLRIAEGRFTGGNLALLDPGFLRANEATLRAAYARRKSVVGLANLLGPALLARLIGSRVVPRLLAIRHLEAAVARALGGATARAVISPFPEVGADIDRPADVAAARRRLRGEPPAPA